MYVAFTLIIFLSTMIFQTSVWHYFGIGIKPDLVLIIVVYLGLVKGPDIGCLSGFFFGLFEDAYASGLHLGANGLTKTIIGFLCGLAGRRLYTQSLFSHILCVGFSTALDVVLLSGIHGFAPRWKDIILYETLYNMICCPLIVFIFRLGERRLHPGASM